jgi:ribosomal protein S18 acetylase RimI-like enzyme
VKDEAIRSKPSGVQISDASSADLDDAVRCLAAAFAHDPITGYLLDRGARYQQRVSQFFSLLMRARLALEMPVLVARSDAGICGASMGYSTTHPKWPMDLAREWQEFENSIPGFTDRMAIYDGVASQFRPTPAHYYLGVIGTEPGMHGRGIGTRLLDSFCAVSSGDSSSRGVYLETAQESNLRFYERAGFAETGRGKLGDATLWCMFRSHARSGS